jgi:DNA primase
MFDYSKHKNRLRDYLEIKGVKVEGSICRCFNPTHEDKNPSCVVSINCYYCPSCGTHGDIYDAVEILEGITDKKEQFYFVENFFFQIL